MKKIIFMFLFIFILSIPVIIADDENKEIEKLEFWFSDKVPCYIWNDVLSNMSATEMTFYFRQNEPIDYLEEVENKYSKKKKTKLVSHNVDVIEIYFNDFLNRNCLQIIPENKIKILEIIQKYKEWNKKAIDEKVTLEKEINVIEYNLSWKSTYGDDWNHSKKNKMYFKFFSQNVKRHQLTINFSKAYDNYNSYIDNTPETLYLDYDYVLLLEKYLSDAYINNQIEKAKKEKEKEDMFK